MKTEKYFGKDAITPEDMPENNLREILMGFPDFDGLVYIKRIEHPKLDFLAQVIRQGDDAGRVIYRGHIEDCEKIVNDYYCNCAYKAGFCPEPINNIVKERSLPKCTHIIY